MNEKLFISITDFNNTAVASFGIGSVVPQKSFAYTVPSTDSFSTVQVQTGAPQTTRLTFTLPPVSVLPQPAKWVGNDIEQCLTHVKKTRGPVEL